MLIEYRLKRSVFHLGSMEVIAVSLNSILDFDSFVVDSIMAYTRGDLVIELSWIMNSHLLQQPTSSYHLQLNFIVQQFCQYLKPMLVVY